MELNTQKMEDFKGRYKYLAIFVGLAFLLIFIRLWSLQVIKGSDPGICLKITAFDSARILLIEECYWIVKGIFWLITAPPSKLISSLKT